MPWLYLGDLKWNHPNAIWLKATKFFQIAFKRFVYYGPKILSEIMKALFADIQNL